MKAFFFVVPLILLLNLPLAASWLATGHMLVSLIAQMNLETLNPKASEKSENLIAMLSDFTLEDRYPFVEGAEWADDIKGQNWKSFNPIHFLNIPITDLTSPENIKTPQPNATWAINELISTIAFPEPSSGPKSKGFEKSISLRLLIHILGDIHQPLHTAAQFNAEFPEGDLGGNKVKINYPKSAISNLHSYWDTMADQYRDIRAPLDHRDFMELLGYATSI